MSVLCQVGNRSVSHRKNLVVLIVGAGLGQLPAIQKAREWGLTVVAVDRNPDAIGMEVADIAIPVDIVDIPAVIKVAQAHKVSAVMTMQSDLPVPTVGAVVDALGLPGIGYETAIICSNKLEMSQRLQERGVSAPQTIGVGSLVEANRAVETIGFPCLFKPADSSGSRGTTKVNETGQIQQAFEDAMANSRLGKVCVQRFIEGIEVGAQTFSVNGRCAQIWVHNDTVSHPPYYIPVGHSFPSQLSQPQLDRIQSTVAAAVEALGIHSGPSNVDLILAHDGQPMIIEIGARIGATCLPELTSCFTGIDWVKTSLQAALGQQPDLTPKQLTPCAAVILESPQDGTLLEYHIPEELYHIEGVHEIAVEVEPGSVVSKLRKGTDRIGKVLVEADSWAKAEEKTQRVKEQIRFVVQENSISANDV
jgi:biotin carboxylase